MPILQELKATGGRDHPRYLYDRLTQYFPQLTARDLAEKTEAGRSRWHRVVQRAAKQLLESGELQRHGAMWEITAKGIARVEVEDLQIVPVSEQNEAPKRTVHHQEAQQMLVEIGAWLGKFAAAEFEHFDVVWRDSLTAPRLSHVFEVQISGSVDSALARLKHAYETQRSQLFLVIADERDQRFADKRLGGSFHEIIERVTIIGTGELQRLHASLQLESALLRKLTRNL
ncbi:MAG: hypothetical protein U0Y68_03035 [Blastocatellia bacterium]